MRMEKRRKKDEDGEGKKKDEDGEKEESVTT